MKVQTFALFSTLCAAPFLLTACNNAQVVAPASAALSSAAPIETQQLKNGLRVELLPVEQADLARLLDAKLLKLRVSSQDKSARMLVSDVKVMRPGQASKSVGGVGVSFAGDSVDVVIGLQPLGDSQTTAKTFKIYTKMGGGASKGTFANPFTSSRSIIFDPQFHADTLFLMTGRKKQNLPIMQETEDVTLALDFRTEPLNNLTNPHSK